MAAEKKLDSDWMLRELVILVNGVEVGQRVPDPGRARVLGTGAHDIAASLSQSGSVPLNT